MVSKCVRCGYTRTEHGEGESTLVSGSSCHRFEVKAPLWLRIFNRRA